MNAVWNGARVTGVNSPPVRARESRLSPRKHNTR